MMRLARHALISVIASAFLLQAEGASSGLNAYTNPITCTPAISTDVNSTVCCEVYSQVTEHGNSSLSSLCALLVYDGKSLSVTEYVSPYGSVQEKTINSAGSTCTSINNSAGERACITFTTFEPRNVCFRLNVSNSPQFPGGSSQTSTACLDLPSLQASRDPGLGRRTASGVNSPALITALYPYLQSLLTLPGIAPYLPCVSALSSLAVSIQAGVPTNSLNDVYSILSNYCLQSITNSGLILPSGGTGGTVGLSNIISILNALARANGGSQLSNTDRLSNIYYILNGLGIGGGSTQSTGGTGAGGRRTL